MIAALTIDAVGTMILPEPGVGAVYAATAARLGVARGAAELDAAFAPAFRATVREWRIPYGADEADARRFWYAVVARTFGPGMPAGLGPALYDAFAEPAAWRVLPGVRAALAVAAARDLPVAVVSNFDCRLAPLLERLALGPLTAVVTSAEAGHAKPDPELLCIACRHLRVAPAQVLHVGDTPDEDGRMAAAAGARFWHRPTGAGLDAAVLHRLLAEPSA